MRILDLRTVLLSTLLPPPPFLSLDGLDHKARKRHVTHTLPSPPTDCIFRGINAVSSRNARTLGGNRTIAEPFSFTVGERIVSFGKSAGDTAGGLFVGGGGPKAPQALSNAAIGMRVGGKRSILVTPELGFGAKGELEIPPNATFELQVEVLGVTA